jgi:proteasome alpha subunit
MLNKSAMGGYDRSSTMFSPEGRLYQVEYALEAVRRGTLAIGIKSKNGAVLAVRKKGSSPLVDPNSIQKIFKVDEHIGCAISGLHADSRVLVDYARILCQNNRLSYDEPVRLRTLVRRLSDIKQQFTQSAGARPFGSGLLFIAVDPDGLAQCMTTSPSGVYWSWKATAMGTNEEQAKNILKENYKEDLSLDDLMKLALKVQKECAEELITADTVQIAYINAADRVFLVTDDAKNKEIIAKL